MGIKKYGQIHINWKGTWKTKFSMNMILNIITLFLLSTISDSWHSPHSWTTSPTARFSSPPEPLDLHKWKRMHQQTKKNTKTKFDQGVKKHLSKKTSIASRSFCLLTLACRYFQVYKEKTEKRHNVNAIDPSHFIEE